MLSKLKWESTFVALNFAIGGRVKEKCQGAWPQSLAWSVRLAVAVIIEGGRGGVHIHGLCHYRLGTLCKMSFGSVHGVTNCLFLILLNYWSDRPILSHSHCQAPPVMTMTTPPVTLAASFSPTSPDLCCACADSLGHHCAGCTLKHTDLKLS